MSEPKRYVVNRSIYIESIRRQFFRKPNGSLDAVEEVRQLRDKDTAKERAEIEEMLAEAQKNYPKLTEEEVQAEVDRIVKGLKLQ